MTIQTHNFDQTPEQPIVLPKRNSESTASIVQAGWTQRNAELMDTAKIAVVDDEVINIEVVQGYLEQEGYKNFVRTTDATKALDLIRESSPDVVLLDVVMPEVNGLEILSAMRSDSRMFHIPVIVLTASSGAETKLKALKLGSTDFLAKPVDPSELLLRLRNVLAMKAYHDHLADHSIELEKKVAERTADLVASRQRIIHCLARAAEFRDDDTGHHVTRVGKYAAVIGTALGFDRGAVDLLEQAAKLHDIGKIGVPDAVLLKKGKLEPNEFNVIKQHCLIGNSIINPMGSTEVDAYRRHTEIGGSLLQQEGYPVMELAAVIARTHHEKWDGSGYPSGLVGEEIPIEGRITAVADVYDALSSKRPYKEAFSRDKCFAILEEGRGTHFDPRVLDAFFSCADKISEIQRCYAEE